VPLNQSIFFCRCAWPGFCLGFEGYIENQGAGRAEKPWVDTETTRGAFQGREANLVGAAPGLTRLGGPYVEKAVELAEFTAGAIQEKFYLRTPLWKVAARTGLGPEAGSRDLETAPGRPCAAVWG
jgi:hypothetical protein